MRPETLFVILAVTATGTFLLRLSFIQLFGNMKAPPMLKEALHFVPASALAALVLPALVYQDGVLNLSASNLRLLSGLAALVVAWKTHSLLLTVLTGMGAFLLLSMLL
ncbi:MAG: AzlD domain-containing protein [Bacillota bacterium]|jgi:branched-subunit amino acid transport protein